MKNWRIKKILVGVTIVLLAAYIITSKLTILPELSIISIIFTLLFLAWAIDGIIDREFVSITLPLALIAWQYDGYLGIEAITPWTLLGCALAMGIGLDIIFKGIRKPWITHGNFAPQGENTFNVDEESVYAENNLGENVHYAYCSRLRKATLENNLGSLTVYLTDCVLDPNGASINAENNLGSTTLIIPAHWNIRIYKEQNLGNIETRGTNTPDPSSPVVQLTAECNMGSLTIIYQ